MTVVAAPQTVREAQDQLQGDAISLIQVAMAETGMSQYDIADILGLKRPAVSILLSGNGNMQLATLAKYLWATGHVVRLVVVPREQEEQ